MSIEKCLLGKVKQGKISQEQAEELSEALRNRQEAFESDMAKGDAEALAAKEIRDQLTKDLQHTKRLVKQQAIADQANLKDMAEAVGSDTESALSLFDWSADGTNNKVRNVAGIEEEVTRVAMSDLNKVVHTLRSKVPGAFVGNKALEDDLARVLHGGKAKAHPEVAELQDAVRTALEYLRKSYNRAGGSIAQRTDYGLPHKHSPDIFKHHFKQKMQALKKADPKLRGDALVTKAMDEAAAEWVNEILPMIRPMKDFETDKVLPLAEQKKLLKEMYTKIYTDGLSELDPANSSRTGKMLANQRQERRVLEFKDGDAWLEYSKKWSHLSPYESIVDHVTSMAKDIALMERFGPNYRSGVKKVIASVKKNEALRGGNPAKAEKKIQLLSDVVDGTANVPVNPKVANIMADIRNVLSAAHLDGAAIAALIGDSATSKLARRLYGLPHWNFAKEFLDEANMSRMTEAQLAQMGASSEIAYSNVLAAARLVGEQQGHRWSRHFSKSVFDVTGLSEITGRRLAHFSFETLGALQDSRKLKLAELNPDMRSMMEQFGIDDEAWDFIRKNADAEEITRVAGRPVEVLDAIGLARRAKTPFEREVASRLIHFMKYGEDIAVPTGTYRSRMLKAGFGRPGTFQRELGEATTMYLTHPFTYMHTHLRNLANSRKTNLGRAAMYGELFLYMTIAGAMTISAKAYLAGKTPPPMTTDEGMPNPEFFGAAILTGGAFSVFGDFFLKDRNAYGRSLGEQVAGPMIGTANDLAKIAAGSPENYARGTRMFLERNIVPEPWYARLAMERLIFDYMEQVLDPQAERKMRQRVRRFERDTGQEYWWAPGENPNPSVVFDE